MNKLISPVLSPTKNDFRRELDLYRRTFPYKSEYVGMSNPYDSSIIRNSVDYDLYLREKLFHDMCEKAAAEELQRRSEELQRRSAKYINRAIFFSVALAMLFFAVILPTSMSSSRNDGYESGHAEGITEGYEQGHSAGYKEGSSVAAENQYNFGYREGEKAGYADGYSEGLRNNNFEVASLPSIEENSQTTVYITASGSKYHRATCSYLANSKYQTTLSAAKSSGYTACSRCNPPK